MKLTLAHLLLLATLCLSLSIPTLFARSSPASLAEREAAPAPAPVLSADDLAYLSALPTAEQEEAFHALVKRKGGGGKGGGGGSSSGGSKGGSSSSSGSSSSGGTRTPTSSFTNAPPSFGAGTAYAGGATRSFKAGGASPGGIRPGLVAGSAFGLVAGSALFLYPFPHTYPYYRNTTTNRNDSLPIDCVCNQDAPCGCDDTNNPALVQEMLRANNGVATIRTVNGTRTVVINGTLVNGTTGAAAGGPRVYTLTDVRAVTNWWVVVAIVGGMVWGL